MSDELVVGPDDGTMFQLGGIAARTIVNAVNTNGALAIVEAPIAPKTLAGPLHTHHNEDSLWYVLEGEFAAQVGEREIHGGPGTVVFGPRDVPHTYWNPGAEPARYLEMAWPAGLERFLEQLGVLAANPTDDTLAQVEDIAQRFGLDMHWDSLAALMEKHAVGFAG